jgi:NAD(P)-dependent dehydrogenase (short-subunit alcohol dehydrogenase family)
VTDVSGVSTEPAPVLTTSIDALLQDVTVNTAGPLHLFQAVYPLLEKSTFSGGGVFMPISSVVGSIADCPPFFVAGYGASKAALNFIGKRIAAEHKNIRVLLVQ